MDNKQLISKKHPDNCQLSTVNCQLSEFISDWKSASPYLEVQTSDRYTQTNHGPQGTDGK